MRHVLGALIIFAISTFSASGAVFQYSVAVTTEKGESEAFLWIPPQAKQVRGVVMAGMTLMERECVKDARIRQACADQQLAILFLKCGLLSADLHKVLDDLALVSGTSSTSRTTTRWAAGATAASGARCGIHRAAAR